MDRLAATRVFIAVADAGSLSAAARRLGLPLTTVSRQLAALEEEVAARLVTRTTRKLALTEPGVRYLEACRRVLEQLDEADRGLLGARSEPEGKLSVTAPIVFGRLHVLPIVTEFLREHPRIDVRLVLLDRSVDLIDEGLDLAVRVGALPDSSLIATRVGGIRLITCASPAYLKARGAPAAPQDLARHDCITFSPLSGVDHWSFAGSKRPLRVPVRSRLIVNTAEAAVDAAVAGLGVVRVFSYQAAQAISDGLLRPILRGYESPEIPVSILHQEGRFPLAKVQAFVAYASAGLRKKLGALAAGPGRRAGHGARTG